MKRVVIVGGGIAGLATAYYLQTRAQGKVNYTLLESAPVLGGKIVSAREKGFVVEGGPDSFITQKTHALELCRELGLGNDLMGTNDAARQVFVWSRGKLHPMPDGVMLIVPTKIMPFLKSPLISWRGKMRMGLDAFIPAKRDDGDESLAHFVRRRLGDEALDKIAEPMIAGIYVADAEDLSLQSTFPRFLDMENKYGGLLRGVLAQKRAASQTRRANGKGNGQAPVSMFMTLRHGVQQLTEAMIAQCDANALRVNQRVVRVQRASDAYAICLDDGAVLHADAVVFAAPSYVTAELVRDLDSALAAQLAQIRYVSTATVSLGYKRAEVAHPLNGFGFVVPRSEKRKILACSWSSTKFSHRAPEEHVLIRAFIGGAHNEALAEQDEALVIQAAREELRAMMGIDAKPVITQVYRWRKANPQYEVGHQARVASIEQRAAQHNGLYLVGSAYHGVGIPDCIADGARVTQTLLAP
ncbi:MAG: protoporphyrinogen oxidase [Chloroflexi bacterium]|nr:protoporphyrinogen oxidase [Chloroflexota bacterium]